MPTLGPHQVHQLHLTYSIVWLCNTGRDLPPGPESAYTAHACQACSLAAMTHHCIAAQCDIVRAISFGNQNFHPFL